MLSSGDGSAKEYACGLEVQVNDNMEGDIELHHLCCRWQALT